MQQPPYSTHTTQTSILVISWYSHPMIPTKCRKHVWYHDFDRGQVASALIHYWYCVLIPYIHLYIGPTLVVMFTFQRSRMNVGLACKLTWTMSIKWNVNESESLVHSFCIKRASLEYLIRCCIESSLYFPLFSPFMNKGWWSTPSNPPPNKNNFFLVSRPNSQNCCELFHFDQSW